MPKNLREEAIHLIQTGQNQTGKQLLAAFLQDNPHDERAWIWLVYAMDTSQERELALQQFQKANPDSAIARTALHAQRALHMQHTLESKPDHQTAALPPPSHTEAQEKTQPVKVRPPVTPVPEPALTSEVETPLPGSVPASQPGKLTPFWVIFSILGGGLMLVVIGFAYWLWLRDSRVIPGFSSTPLATLPAGTPGSNAFMPPAASAIPSPTPTRTLSPAPWLIAQLPTLSAANIGGLAEIASWPEPLLASLSSDWEILALFDGETIQLWDLPRHARLLTLVESAVMVTDLTFSPTDSLVATADQDQRIQLWEPVSGELLHTLHFDADQLAAVAEVVQSSYSRAVSLSFSPDGRYIAGVTYGLATIWNVKTAKPVQTITFDPAELETLNLEGTEAALELVFSPDGKMYAVRAIGKITVKEIETGREIRPFLAPGALGMRFSPDGSLLLEAGNGYIALWDLQNGEEILYIKGLYNSDYAPNAFVFSPDGTWLAIEAEGPENGVEVQVWDIQNRQKVHAFPVFSQRLYSLDFSPDSHLLAAGGSQGLARIWDLEKGEELVQINEVSSLVFSSAGQALVGLRGEDLIVLGLYANASRIGLTPTPTPSLTTTPQ
ncbi:MAG: PD40 domain-containing protein [Anaerolineaceae bacterium]|nr:PD40 domain-containing protein [Anaerolineaceae bacterium]